MSNASGPAAQGLIPADFEHQRSGIHYQITGENGHVWLSFDRADTHRPLNGSRELLYFIGSGMRGRTYLFQQQGYWFESPINWYAKKRIWDMAPNFLSSEEMPLTLPVDSGCLHCHASGAASSLPDARNHYSAEPFVIAGITCAECHGDARAHMASGGKVRMQDIDALEPVRRDSICLNCHLEGQAAVDRVGKRTEEFVPGDNLFEFTSFFAYRNEDGSGGRATSEWEALLKSACKQKSGDKLTCTTCHDPHGSPAPEDRVAFYRRRCLQCHNNGAFAQTHHPDNPDCTECHMARPPSNDIAHEQITDHWIRKRVSKSRLPVATSGKLEAVDGMGVDDRDLGLAYAQMAARGDQQAGHRAVELLTSAEKESGRGEEDHALHSQLGFLEQLDGHLDTAVREYRLALRSDPYDALAAGDLALIEAQRSNPAEAIRLWQGVFEHDPTQRTAAMNLAIVECREGMRAAAIGTLERLLAFAPDDASARSLAERVQTGESACGTK